jgi:phospholipid/cholesterol/gamma-HCH transport system substrate-binding protein
MVGFFVTIGVAALLMLALKVANAGISGSGETYNLFAKFDNIGGLKVRSPIKVGGVVVGRVSNKALDDED